MGEYIGVNIKVNVDDTKKIYDFIAKKIRKNWFLVQEEFYEAVKKTSEVMKQRIEETRKREKDGEGIADLLEPKEIYNPEKGGYLIGEVRMGIGEIKELNEKAPYWYWINYGIAKSGTTVPGKGKKVPAGQFTNEPKPSKNVPQTGRWIEGGDYTFKAKKPIEPKHFIEAGQEYLKRKIKEIIKKYSREK